MLTARTASGSRGSRLGRPLLLAPGSTQMQERLPGPCPGKGWARCTAHFPPELSLSMASLSLNGNFLSQLLSERGLCDLDKRRHLSHFFLAS